MKITFTSKIGLAPEDIQFIEGIVPIAVENFNNAKGGLVPVSLIVTTVRDDGGKQAAHLIEAMAMEFTGQAEKEAAASILRRTVRDRHADSVITILPAWTLPKDVKHIPGKRVAEHDGAVECISFNYENRRGTWAGMLATNATEVIGDSVEMMKVESSDGIFSNLIHIKEVMN